MERERGDVRVRLSDRLGLAAVDDRASAGAGGVFDDRNSAAPTDVRDGADVARHSDLVHGENGLRARRDRGLDELRVHVVRRGVDIDEHRLGPAVADAVRGRDVRVADRDDLVTLADAGRKEREMERRRAVRHRAAVRRADQRRELGFESGDFGPLGEPARQDRALGGFRLGFPHQGFRNRDVSRRRRRAHAAAPDFFV